MIHDLASQPGGRIEADIVIIGAGIAGLLLGTRLARMSLRVVIVEAGAERQDEETHPFNAVEQLGSSYAGAEHGRFRCLGGTSTRWGGALIPFQPADIDCPASPWPLRFSELADFLPELEQLFGLPPTPYDMPDMFSSPEGSIPSFLPRLAKWPAFASRNVANLFRRELAARDGPEVWLNASATDFVFAPGGRLDHIVARSIQGGSMTLAARQFVIAAGAIESTRLLLLADRAADQRIFRPYDVLGRYFHDHLAAHVAEVVPRDRASINRVFGFRFEGKAMRNLRFETAPTAAAREALSPCFAHVGFSEVAGSGFEALRAVLRHVQQSKLPGPALFGQLAATSPWLLRAVWWRLVHQRLLFPPAVPLDLHMVIEQAPDHANRITLSTGKCDAFGNPLAAIDWSVREVDRDRLERSTRHFCEYWDTTSLADLGTLRPLPAGQAQKVVSASGGVYHPGGSTRLGRTSADGVVDSDLRCFGIPNLNLASTSVFPTGGGANPTMMLMLATMRLADRLAGELK